jgi:glycosyltransferase involved in cell wall biosynthesis
MTGFPQDWVVPTFEPQFFTGRRHRFVVVIPVLNEGERLARLLARMAALKLHETIDILIVDGGTGDGSVDRQSVEPKGVRGVLIKTGAGRLSAQLRVAYAVALAEGYDGIITIDGNDKDDPGAIPQFIAALEAGVDFVQASRFLPGGEAENTPPARDLAIRFVHAPILSLASGFHWTDTTQGFRAYSARLLRDQRVAPFRAVFSGYELLAYLSACAPRLGFRCVELPTARRYPKGEVPTKISAVRGNLSILLVLVRAALGFYAP